MNPLIALAERCEKATGSDRRIDGDIFVALGKAKYTGNDLWMPGKVATGLTGFWEDAPAFTGSLNTALTLVPEGYYWHVGHGRTRDDEPLGGASIITPGSLDTLTEAEAPTAALALCAAALRARAEIAA